MSKACHPANYAKGRGNCAVEYIVIHYTANNADTAAGNCSYFANNAVQASAHYFVDENGWAQSVDEADTAWHCGAKNYRHPVCRNANSIGVELCSRLAATGQYLFVPETVRNAQQLVRSLLAKYGLPPDRVLRHYDVTGKICPMPFVENQKAWHAFVAELPQAPIASQPPSVWATEATRWAVEQGMFRGDEAGRYRWHDPVTRQELAVILQRLQS